jgi:hypothetical protein
MNMNDILTGIVNVAPPLALFAVLYAAGMILKAVPHIPNWIIPCVLPVLGAVIYPYVGEYSEVVKAARVPWAMMALYGFGIGWATTGANQALSQFKGRNETEKEIPK